MNVFGYTVDGERNIIIAELVASNEKILQNQTDINKKFVEQGVSIKKLEEKLETLSTTYENVVNVQLKGINAIIPEIIDRVNTIKVYLEDSGVWTEKKSIEKKEQEEKNNGNIK